MLNKLKSVMIPMLIGAFFVTDAVCQPAYTPLNDPLEPVNRAVFEFNLAVQKVFLRPVAKGYDAVTPEFAQARVEDFLIFLRSPIQFGNNVLQGDMEGAADTVVRFIVNGTIGIFGLIDVMEPKIPYRKEDFGQTLAVWGVESGPYLILPFLGPSTVRDTGGFVVDGLSDPMPAFAENRDLISESEYGIGKAFIGAIVAEANRYEMLEKLEAESLDYYAAVRSFHGQNRHRQIYNLDPETALDKASADAPQSAPELAWD